MKLRVYIGIVLMVMMVGCKPPTTSPRPSPGGEGGELSLSGDSSLGRVIDSPAFQAPSQEGERTNKTNKKPIEL